MAEITLRAYVKEIDDLIEREKLDEAIAHCRHILQVYPKHLDTYRLLGKAYLEAKRFGDAADIFQRVLSAVPDDFVSHVGMALVREDEGNLDAAIWHMERAFETTPSNPAIRQELSRLIGRRDGLEPHKVRLTRGALARQYARGELFPQAIAELRSALQEDPDRPDLEVLLAKMYWRGGQLKEAKKICAQILEKLPFSLEANRIMADISDKEGDQQRAGEFHRKLAGLDPYFGFLESVELDPNSVDSGAVRVDQSTWSPGEPLPTVEAKPPEWVTSLGVDLSEGDSDAINASPQPAWLSDLDSSSGDRPRASAINEPAFDGSDLNRELESEDAIPEWMREAGWGPSTGETPEEAPVSFSDAELGALESGAGPIAPPADENSELEPAEIPSWMRSIAPKDESQVEEPARTAPAPEESMDEGMIPDWLSEIASEDETASSESELPAQESEAESEIPAVEAEEALEAGPEIDEGPEVPTWIDTQSPGATSTIIAWLGDRDEEVTDEEQAVDDLAAAFGAGGEGQLEDFPSWLEENEETPTDEGNEQASAKPGEPEGPPSWLAGVAEAASQQDAPAESPPQSSGSEPESPGYRGVDTGGDTESWVRTLAEQEGTAPQSTPTPGGSDWLTGIGDDEVAEAGSGEATPDWLSSEPSEEDEVIASRLSSAAQTPDWLEGVEEVGPEVGAEQGDVPDWLMGIAEGASPRPTAEPSGFDDSEGGNGETPDWLGEFSSDVEQASSIEPEFDLQANQGYEAGLSQSAEAMTPTAASSAGAVSEDLDDEEVFKWLESLAENQEAEGEESLGKPTQQPVDEVTPTVAEPGLLETVPPDEPDESLQWLENLASERGIDVDIEASSFQATIQQPEIESMPEESLPEGSLPEASLVETAAEHAEPASSSEPVEESSPDWLIEMATSDSDETVMAGRSRAGATPEEAPPAILPVESEPGAPEIEEPAEMEIPGWLDEAAAVAQEVPAEPAPGAEQLPPQPTPEAPPQIVSPATPAMEAPEPATTAPETAEPIAGKQPAPPIPTPPPAKELATPTAAAPAEHAEAEVVKEEPAAPPVSQASIPSSDLKAGKPEPAKKSPQAEAGQTRYKEPMTDAKLLLKSARGALAAGDAGRALSDYKKLIERKQDLETVISDLRQALDRYPNLPTLWQALGDAYMKADKLNDAIKAYQRGMEVA